jgi:hypothetical protein
MQTFKKILRFRFDDEIVNAFEKGEGSVGQKINTNSSAA